MLSSFLELVHSNTAFFVNKPSLSWTYILLYSFDIFIACNFQLNLRLISCLFVCLLFISLIVFSKRVIMQTRPTLTPYIFFAVIYPCPCFRELVEDFFKEVLQ